MRHGNTLPSLVLLTTGALALVGCSSSAAPARKDAANAVKLGIPVELVTTTADGAVIKLLPADTGQKLVFGMNLTSPPSRFKDDKGKQVGFNVDIARLIAKKLGKDIKIEDTTFEAIIPGLQSGRFDLTVSSMSRTDERLEQMDMIEYMGAGEGALFKKGNPDDIQASAKTSLCGLRVAAMSGSYQEQTSLPETSKKCAEADKNPVKATAFPSNNESILAVSSGRVDAAIADTPVVQYAQTQNKATFESLIFDGTKSHNNVGLPKGSPLTPAVAAALQKLMDEGSYQKVFDKWGIGNLALTVASTKQTPVGQ
ncbi:ABC transporter substrate-binding protein [Streptomyces sp. NBC_01716]|uniref:ABC transporter substrate-binding protein n=1 Tax=Streptomyces sp. NBC_01716 TaxID=2975917 RepID=UPI002E365924|nr:ABC transporter substrate-binding protein [Streptomyces sp. NBC_01716]